MDANPKLELTNQEKKAVFNIYLESEMYQEALDIYPKGAEELIANVRANENMAVLLELKDVTSKPVLFEQYMLQEEYDFASQLILDIDYQLPERQESIVKAYIYTDDIVNASATAKTSELDLKGKMIEWYTDFVNKSEVPDAEKKTKIEDGTTLINREMDV